MGRLIAILGGAAGVAAALVAIAMHMGNPPKSLLYSNLDLKEASQITSTLDQSGVKYEIKGDGSTIFVERDKVASTRLLLSGKGLPTSGRTPPPSDLGRCRWVNTAFSSRSGRASSSVRTASPGSRARRATVLRR